MHFLCRCVCNIDCSGYNMNPVCGSDGQSYSNPCQIREASCLKQAQINVKHLGQCPGKRTQTNHTSANTCRDKYLKFFCNQI